jgi:nicotinamide-nucleotide amidase
MGQRLVVVETSSGGTICRLLTRISGASNWFAGGVIAYGVEARKYFLGFDESAVLDEGLVSRSAAVLLAQQSRRRAGVAWALAETGIAGPQTGRQSRKPEGLVYTAVSGPSIVDVRMEQATEGSRDGNQEVFAFYALRHLASILIGQSPGEG